LWVFSKLFKANISIYTNIGRRKTSGHSAKPVERVFAEDP